jgi:FKBP-type peptidyl-prolyl cis-trans isomerase
MTGSSAIKYVGISVVFVVAGLLVFLSFRVSPENRSLTASINTMPEKSQLKIDVITPGTGDIAENGKVVTVYYVGKLTDGTIFDKNTSGPWFSFPLGAHRVIAGWELGVAGMKVGEKRTLTIPSDLAYGKDGFPGVIPPDATLVFDVELLGVK